VAGLFQPSLMFVGKARSLPYSGEPESFFTQVGSGLSHKHWASLERLERLARGQTLELIIDICNYRCIFFMTEAMG
jgi:hypothetical protein